MMVTTVRGTFTDVSGSITIDEDDPSRSGGSFSVRVASLTTGVEPRDAHLRSADLFDVEQHPEATFVATEVRPKGGNGYAVTGDLTIRGTTRPVTWDVEVLGFYTGMNGARRVGLHAGARLQREAFGLGWNVALESGGWLVGKEVTLELELAFEQARVAEADAGDAAAAA
jgi:polyisoprenoid-binding protein YceI